MLKNKPFSEAVKTFLRPIKGYGRSQWWALKRWATPVRFPENSNGKILLHLGCGPIKAEGYTNIDAQPLPHIHYVHDAFPLEMIASKSVDMVYASHILEHFSWVQTEKVLREWCRVLKVGGILRLGVPNFEVLLQIYNETADLNDIRGPLMGGQSDAYNFHYSVFDRKYLTALLLGVGFTEVRYWSPDAVDHHDFTDTTSTVWRIRDKEYEISLNLEAIR